MTLLHFEQLIRCRRLIPGLRRSQTGRAQIPQITTAARSLLRTAFILCGGMLMDISQATAQLPQISGRPSGSPVVVRPAGLRQAVISQSSEPASQQEWFRIEFDGKAVGYESITTTAAFPESGSKADAAGRLVRRVRDTRLKLRRFGTDLSVSARLETVETLDGLLQSWSLRRSAADGASIKRTGIWNEKKSGFDITEQIAGSLHAQLLPSNGPPRSAVLSAWIGTASQNAPRLWSSAVLFPETAAVVDIQIDSIGRQSLKLADGKTIAVTRFDYWPSNSPETKSSLYYDDSLSLVRMEQPLMGQTLRLERADAAGALGQNSTEALDLQFNSVLPLKRPLTDLDRRESLRLSISVGATEQISLPPSDFQSVEQTVPNELIVTLTRPAHIEHPDAAAIPSSRKIRVDPVYTSPSRWITSDDESIKRKGVMVAGSTSISLEKCRRLTRHLWKEMRFSPFSTSLQPAASAAKSLQGDCTEHAVLLTALMRSQGIPARVALGFVYVPNPVSFAPHMWTEAFLDDKWIPFDSTRGLDGVGLTHLKITDSPLSDETGSGAVLFVPLLNFLGRATVDVAPM